MNKTTQSIVKSRHVAIDSQRERLEECKSASPYIQEVCGQEILVMPGVYGTSVDTELMIDTVQLAPHQTFLEIGCGTGAITLLLAQKCQHGTATDVNPLAIENARQNAERLNIQNVDFVEGDGFGNLPGQYDVLICNPPYNNYAARDTIDRMFWDPEDHVKQLFFREAKEHLFPGGRIYFGWADFADIDVDLPFKLAEECGFAFQSKVERPSHSGKYRFLVLEFTVKK